MIPWENSFWYGNDLIPLVSFTFTVLHIEGELLALQMPGEFLPLTPEIQDNSFSLQCSLSPHNPHFPDNLLSVPMIIKKLSDTVPSYLVFGHCVHPGKSHFHQQHHCCHWRGERGSSDTASLSVPITSGGKTSPMCLIHLEGRLFQLQSFSLLTMFTIDVFSCRHTLPLWSSWVFVNKMHFPLYSGKLLPFGWISTSLKSLLLPNLFESQLAHITIHKWEWNEKDICSLFSHHHYYSIHVSFRFISDWILNRRKAGTTHHDLLIKLLQSVVFFPLFVITFQVFKAWSGWKCSACTLCKSMDDIPVLKRS